MSMRAGSSASPCSQTNTPVLENLIHVWSDEISFHLPIYSWRDEKLAAPYDDCDRTCCCLTCQVESLGLPVKVAQLEPVSPNNNNLPLRNHTQPLWCPQHWLPNCVGSWSLQDKNRQFSVQGSSNLPSQEELCQTHILHSGKTGWAVWSLETGQKEPEEAPLPDLHRNASQLHPSLLHHQDHHHAPLLHSPDCDAFHVHYAHGVHAAYLSLPLPHLGLEPAPGHWHQYEVGCADALEGFWDLCHGLHCVVVAQYDVHVGLERSVQGNLSLTSHKVFALKIYLLCLCTVMMSTSLLTDPQMVHLLCRQMTLGASMNVLLMYQASHYRKKCHLVAWCCTWWCQKEGHFNHLNYHISSLTIIWSCRGKRCQRYKN